MFFSCLKLKILPKSGPPNPPKRREKEGGTLKRRGKLRGKLFDKKKIIFLEFFKILIIKNPYSTINLPLFV